MKKFIALVALVLVSASTLMYAQESQRDIRRADRKAQRDAERARLKAEDKLPTKWPISKPYRLSKTNSLYWKPIR